MPRRITNKFQLPESFVSAVSNDQYVKKGDISCTSIIGPPLIGILRENFEYEEDVIDLLWSMFGSAMHKVMELADEKMVQKFNYNVKNEISMILDVEGVKLSGTFDRLLYNKKIEDYKFTSLWKVRKLPLLVTNDNVPYYVATEEESYEWIWQQNIYRGMLYWCHGIEVKDIEIIAVLKDFKESEKKRDKDGDYPYAQAVRVVIPIKSYEEIWNFIVQRVRLHMKAREDFKLKGIAGVPVCTPEERWAKPDTYKFYNKEGDVRSRMNIEITSEEAMAKAQMTILEWDKLGKPYKLFKGVDTRCEDWCPVNKYCHYYQSKNK